MELRTLHYFHVLAREGSITGAAQALHITAPTLSRQLASLEREFGRELYRRTSRGIVLTEHGLILDRYAETFTDLADKVRDELALPANTVSGPMHVSAGETHMTSLLARTFAAVRQSYPDVTFQLYSGSSTDLLENLARGAYDFMLECEVRPHVDMNVLELPGGDTWGVLVPAADSLAQKKAVRPNDLLNRPLICSRQAMASKMFHDWAKELAEQMDVVAYYNLPCNGRYFVEQGVGIMLTYDGIFETHTGGSIAFVPLDPPLISRQGIIWRKVIPTPPAQVFLDELRRQIGFEEFAAASKTGQPQGD